MHLAKAALRFLWQQARKMADKPAATQPAPPPVAATAPADPAAVKAAPSVPKEIPHAVLQQLVQDYEMNTIGGRKREFPMKLLLGAERVVSRCWHEVHTSQMFTPVLLHEILEARHFSSSGELNPLSSQFKQKSSAHKLTVDKDMNPIVIEDESGWSPKGVLSLMDAMEAICHCWVLVKMAHELDVVRYTGWWVQQFRSKPQKLEQLKAYWLEASWKMALQMRQGATFVTVANQIMDDNSSLQAALNKELPKPKGSGKEAKTPAPSKGKGKRTWNQEPSNYGRGQHRAEPWNTSRSWGSSWNASSAKAAPVPDPGEPAKKRQRTEAAPPHVVSPRAPFSFPPPEQIPRPAAKKWILLSFFDGIGAARVAMEPILKRHDLEIHYIAWEYDQVCCNITKKHYPEVIHRGDKDSPEKVAELINSIDPSGECSLVATAGPPCPDFSRIKGDQGAGKEGPEGQKFGQWIQWMRRLQPLLRQRHLLRLVENVIPHRKQDIRYFEEALEAKAVQVDSAMFGLVSRPRMWWSDLPLDTDSNEVLDFKAKWSWQYDAPLLHVKVPQDQIPAGPTGWTPPACWSKQKTLPTQTTPAETAEGRPAPRSAKGKIDSATHQRWCDGNKQYAPWHYSADYMWVDQNGEYHLPTAAQKEVMHHFPAGWTSVEGTSDKARHKAIANSWHVGVASMLLAMLLAIPQTAALQVHAALNPLGNNALDFMANLWQSSPLLCGPGERADASHHFITLQDPWEHWRTAAQVVNEAKELAADLEDELHAKLSTLKPHIQKLYDPAHEGTIHLPLVNRLAKQFQWPDETLLFELETGFDLTGRLSSGAGWQPRSDGRYANPTPHHTFLRDNLEYVKHKLQSGRTDQHWQQLLEEIINDVKIGRMDGPFAAPPEWGIKTIPVGHNAATSRLLEGPAAHPPTSFAFSIEQVGSDNRLKVRRGEDWRRSHHNETVETFDTPPTHRPDTFAAIARWIHRHGGEPSIWGSDQEAAYRQLPVANPQETYVLLKIPGGYTLWYHHCLLFGSSGSVWGYSRTADFLMWICRAALLVPMVHYVDDFAAVEDKKTIQCGFDSAHDLLGCFGFRFKPSKMQPPDAQQRIQGVIMEVKPDHFEIAPDPSRLQKITSELKTVLQENNLTAPQASKLAGKLQFLQEATKGSSIRACMHPLYKHATTASLNHRNCQLQDDTRDAIESLLQLLPRQQPFEAHYTDQPTSVLYADAFFKAGDKRIRLSEATQDATWSADAANLMENGWGVIIRHSSGKTYFANGSIPPELLAHFTTRRAYIYSLEILSQVIGLILGQHILDKQVWCFCDNEPGRCAITRGFGRDLKVNRLLNCAWQFIQGASLSPSFQRVTSSANMSDSISRGDLSMAKMLGWQRLETDWDGLYKLLVQATREKTDRSQTAAALQNFAAFHDGMGHRFAETWKSTP
eukprot:Skav223504  [mRNA]  locus=scaffold1160:147994:152414:- [translate_table: standard]